MMCVKRLTQSVYKHSLINFKSPAKFVSMKTIKCAEISTKGVVENVTFRYFVYFSWETDKNLTLYLTKVALLLYTYSISQKIYRFLTCRI